MYLGSEVCDTPEPNLDIQTCVSQNDWLYL